jgi:cytochrome c-type biogenesis protein CcmH/NrfF
MKLSSMPSRRAFLRALAVAPAAAAVAVGSARLAGAQPQMPAMGEGGVIEIHNEHERKVFNELQCTCGCPRDAIGTCNCEYAAKFRSEVRAMMAEGMTDEQIRAEWVRRYGPQALMVPPNAGGNRLLYLAPLAVIVGGAALVVTLLKRFRARDMQTAAVAAEAPAAKGGRDEYDDKLDEELKQLDDE